MCVGFIKLLDKEEEQRNTQEVLNRSGQNSDKYTRLSSFDIEARFDEYIRLSKSKSNPKAKFKDAHGQIEFINAYNCIKFFEKINLSCTKPFMFAVIFCAMNNLKFRKSLVTTNKELNLVQELLVRYRQEIRIFGELMYGELFEEPEWFKFPT